MIHDSKQFGRDIARHSNRIFLTLSTSATENKTDQNIFTSTMSKERLKACATFSIQGEIQKCYWEISLKVNHCILFFTQIILEGELQLVFPEVKRIIFDCQSFNSSTLTNG